MCISDFGHVWSYAKQIGSLYFVPNLLSKKSVQLCGVFLPLTSAEASEKSSWWQERQEDHDGPISLT